MVRYPRTPVPEDPVPEDPVPEDATYLPPVSLITGGNVLEVVIFGLVLLRCLHRTVCRELTVLALLLVELLVLQVQEFRVLQVREFRVLRLPDLLVSSVDGLAVEVGPLVEVATGLGRQASNGQWKCCPSYLRVAK